MEHISNARLLGAKTLFATHYHELTELEGKIDSVNNYCIAVKEKGDDIVFLRKIVKGGADRSYGIQVAKLAGVPETVITRAREISEELSDADITTRVRQMSVQGQERKEKRNLKSLMWWIWRRSLCLIQRRIMMSSRSLSQWISAA